MVGLVAVRNGRMYRRTSTETNICNPRSDFVDCCLSVERESGDLVETEGALERRDWGHVTL